MLSHHRPHRQGLLKKSLRGKNRLSPIPEEEQSCGHDFVDPLRAESYSTFHFLINQERTLRGRNALYRSSVLDSLALNQATRMASENRVMHSVGAIKELQTFLGSSKAGENVQRGENPLVMHEYAMVNHPVNKSNILSSCFHEFGVGVATGDDGHLYVCQVFRGATKTKVHV